MMRRYVRLESPARADADQAALLGLTALAARLCGISTAWVTLLDADRHWPVAPPVPDLGAVFWEHSRCSSGDDPVAAVIVPDTLEDPRLAQHPAVHGRPGIRFYAGVPLVTATGELLGALSVADPGPGDLTTAQLGDLATVADQVVGQLERQQRLDALVQQVTVQESALAELRETQLLLDGILENTDVLIYAKDLHGRFLLANSALRQSIGDRGGDLLGRTGHQLFPAEAANLFRDNDSQIVRSGLRQVFAEDLRLPDGTVHSYRSTKFPLRDDNQHVFAVAGVSTDITELTATRQALEESEKRWRALVEHSLVAVAVIRTDGSFAYANPPALTLLEAPNLEQLIGRSALDFVPAAEHRTARTLFAPLGITGAPPVLAQRGTLRRADGTDLAVEMHAAHVMHDGQPAVQLEIRDVSAHAAAEKALRASERRFRTLFDRSPIALSLSDEKGLWVVANAAFGQLLGVDPASLVGASAEDYAHPDDRVLVASSEQGQRESPDGVLRMEMRLIRPSGEQRWAWVTVTPTSGPHGEPWTLGIALDITERKAQETALRHSEENLAAIAAVARCVQSGADPRSVVVDWVRSLAGAATVAMLEAADGDTLMVTACEGTDLLGKSISLAETSVTAHVWRTGQQKFLSDAADDPMVNQRLLALDASVSVLWQPVVVEGEVIAVLNVTWQHRVADVGDRAVQAVQVLADEAGASLHAAQLRAELVRSAATDPLTGALNRRAWEAELATLMEKSRRTDSPLTVALIDLDHFKAYNDSFGHMAGDLVLSEFAVAAREMLRSADLFARWGGEEFITALPDCTSEQAGIILQRVRTSVPAGLTCSIGYTRWDGKEPTTLCLARADAALYDAKHNGRNQVVAR